MINNIKKWWWRKRYGLDLNVTPKQIAISNLNSYKTKLLYDKDVRQVVMNVATDKLRLYLGESSKVYYSFSQIDISTGDKSEKTKNAAELLDAAIGMVEYDGIFEDLDRQLVRLNIKSFKNKTKYAISGAIGGALLSHLPDIGKFVLRLLQLIHK